jgi:hypothetical protein
MEKIDSVGKSTLAVLSKTGQKVNEIIDWINAREKQMKANADMLEEALEALEKAGFDSHIKENVNELE